MNESFYMTIFSQQFSPCGKYISASNNYGKIATFKIEDIVSGKNSSGSSWQAHNSSVQCLTSTSTHLLSAATEIRGWGWDGVLEDKVHKPSFEMTLPHSQQTFERPEINALKLSDNKVFAGAGDSNIYCLDVESNQHVTTLSAHDDYILSLSVRGNVCVSGGEDGTVRFWDTRQKKQVNKITPSDNEKLHREQHGKWIGTVDHNDDWMICGGGPRLSLWHMRTLSLSKPLPPDSAPVNIAYFYDDHIFAGGGAGQLYQMDYNGDLITEIITTPSSVYSIAVQEEPHKILTFAGTSSTIDVCTNFHYKDLKIKFP